MQYSFHKKCDTFARTSIGRTWLAEVVSQGTHIAYDCSGPPQSKYTSYAHKIFELSKIKSIAFGRNSPSVRVKPSVTNGEAS